MNKKEFNHQLQMERLEAYLIAIAELEKNK